MGGLPGLFTIENNIRLEDRTTFRTEEVRLNKSNLSLKMEEFPVIVPNSKLNKVHPMVNFFSPGIGYSKSPISRTTNAFFKSLGKK